MKLKMKLKSVSSLILLMGTLAYAAMQVGVSGPARGDSQRPRGANLTSATDQCEKMLPAGKSLATTSANLFRYGTIIREGSA